MAKQNPPTELPTDDQAEQEPTEMEQLLAELEGAKEKVKQLEEMTQLAQELDRQLRKSKQLLGLLMDAFTKSA